MTKEKVMEQTENKNKILTSPIFVTAMALVCTALWGSATPFIKTGYQYCLPEQNVPSILLFAGTRFTLAGIITVIIYSIARRKLLYPKKENIVLIAKVGVFQTVLQYIFFYVGLANTTGVKGTIASGTGTFFSILIASLIFHQEKLTVKKIVACMLGLAGIIIVNLNGIELTINFLGDVFVIFSAIAYSVSSVLTKRYSKYEDPVVISGYQFIGGGIFMIIIGLVFGGKMQFTSGTGIAVLIYLAFLSAIAFSVWGILLKYNPVSKVTVFCFMTPVFGTIFSMLMLTEDSKVKPLNLIVTLILICTGVLMINYQKPVKEPK